MRKATIFAACGIITLALAAAACTKEQAQRTQPASATLTLSLPAIEHGTFTKAAADDLPALINATLPTALQCYLTNTGTAQTYKVQTGESITLPLGSYRVTASHTPTGDDVGNWEFTTSPRITIGETFEVQAGTTSYTLTPSFGSTAIAVRTDEVAALAWKNGSSSTGITRTTEAGGYLLTFVRWKTSADLTLAITPQDALNYTPSEFTFSTASPTPSGKYAGTGGVWYLLHPAAVPTEQGAFSLGWPAWEGMEL